MKLYLAGRMKDILMSNLPEFFEAAIALRELGHEVDNPAEHNMVMGFDPSRTAEEQDFDLGEAFRWDIEKVINSEGIVLLPKWKLSEGALLEATVAHFVRITRYEYDETVKGLLNVISWAPPSLVGAECAAAGRAEGSLD